MQELVLIQPGSSIGSSGKAQRLASEAAAEAAAKSGIDAPMDGAPQAAAEATTRAALEAATRAAFESHLVECGPLAFRVARGVLRNTADAEDVAQEALLRAFRRFKHLRERARFRAWLVRIAFRLALDRARSAKRREQRETLWSQPERRPPTANAEELAV